MITVTDIFAGAGGSTSGAIMVPGVEVRVSANHWQLAVEVLIRSTEPSRSWAEGD